MRARVFLTPWHPAPRQHKAHVSTMNGAVCPVLPSTSVLGIASTEPCCLPVFGIRGQQQDPPVSTCNTSGAAGSPGALGVCFVPAVTPIPSSSSHMSYIPYIGTWIGFITQADPEPLLLIDCSPLPVAHRQSPAAVAHCFAKLQPASA